MNAFEALERLFCTCSGIEHVRLNTSNGIVNIPANQTNRKKGQCVPNQRHFNVTIAILKPPPLGGRGRPSTHDQKNHGEVAGNHDLFIQIKGVEEENDRVRTKLSGSSSDLLPHQWTRVRTQTKRFVFLEEH